VVPQAPREVDRVERVSPSPGGRVWGGVCAPFPENFFVFLVANTIF